jgi:hypothetical protein
MGLLTLHGHAYEGGSARKIEPCLLLFMDLQEDKFERAEELTEEAKFAAREAHLKAEEAMKKQEEAERLNQKAAADRSKQQADVQKLEELRMHVRYHMISHAISFHTSYLPI